MAPNCRRTELRAHLASIRVQPFAWLHNLQPSRRRESRISQRPSFSPSVTAMHSAKVAFPGPSQPTHSAVGKPADCSQKNPPMLRFRPLPPVIPRDLLLPYLAPN